MTMTCRIMLAAALLAPVSSLRAQLVGVQFDTGSFYTISTTDGSLQLIGDTGIDRIGALEFNPFDGSIYGFTTGDAKSTNLYRFTISPTLDSVTAELIGPLGLSTYEGGLAFSAGGGVYAVNGGITLPALLSVDLNTGDASVIHMFADRHDFNGLGMRSDGMLIGLDATTNSLLAIDPLTADVSTIKNTNGVVGTIGGMALNSNVGYFMTAGPQAAIPGSNSLYSFDPFTGDQVLIANYQDVVTGSGFSGLTFVPEPASLALLAVGSLSLLRRRTQKI